MDSSTELEREIAITRERMAAELGALTTRLDLRTQLRHRYDGAVADLRTRLDRLRGDHDGRPAALTGVLDQVVEDYPWAVLVAGLLGGLLAGRLVFHRR
jgi:ElaB/YqjD/DUF883 family membrane-anchored ribosome-binding protein